MRELIKSSLSLSHLRTINIIFINPTKPMLINLQKKKINLSSSEENIFSYNANKMSIPLKFKSI